MLAIGNGESRTNINIDNIASQKVGCNALWRDYSVDYLVCVDKRMVEECIRGNVNTNALSKLMYIMPKVIIVTILRPLIMFAIALVIMYFLVVILYVL